MRETLKVHRLLHALNAELLGKSYCYLSCPLFQIPWSQPIRLPVHGIFSTEPLGWYSCMSLPGILSTQDQTVVPSIADRFFTIYKPAGKLGYLSAHNLRKLFWGLDPNSHYLNCFIPFQKHVENEFLFLSSAPAASREMKDPCFAVFCSLTFKLP